MSEGKVEQSPLRSLATESIRAILDVEPDDIQGQIYHAVKLTSDAVAEAYERGVRDAAKANCFWCKEGNPIAEPLYGRAQEVWHKAYPDVPDDTQCVRCKSGDILALLQANPYRAVVETEAKK